MIDEYGKYHLEIFDRIVWQPHPVWHQVDNDAYMGTIYFANRYGASVITGKNAYTSDALRYEMAAWYFNLKQREWTCLDRLTRIPEFDQCNSGDHAGLVGWLSRDEVNDILTRMEALSPVGAKHRK